MSNNTHKAIIIVNSKLNPGLIANTTACLGFGLGARLPHEIGPNHIDADGVKHTGMLNIPLPILTTTPEHLKTIVPKAYASDSLYVCDMSDQAQAAKTQDEYAERLAKTKNADLNYWAVIIYGPKSTVNKIGGGLKLYNGPQLS